MMFARALRIVERARRVSAGAAAWLRNRRSGFAPEQIAILEGLRAALAIGGIIALAELTNRPVLAWGAFAAFWTCIVDPGGPVLARLKIMGGFILAGALLATVAPITAGQGTLPAAFALLVLVGLSSGARLVAPEAAQPGTLASVVTIVSINHPAPVMDALRFGAVFAAGGLLALVLCVFLWPIHPHRPARRTVATVMRALDAMAREIGAHRAEPSLQRRAGIRHAIEAARTTIDRAALIRATELHRDLLRAVEAGERIFAGLIALGAGMATTSVHEDDSETQELVLALHQALTLIAHEALRTNPDWQRLAEPVESLAALAARNRGLTGRVAAECHDGLAHLLTAPGEEPRATPGATRQSGAPAATIARASALRHAARVSVVVSTGFLAISALKIPYGYWALVAVVTVMQPQAGATSSRTLDRVLGSVIGGAVAGVLAASLTTPWQLVGLIFPLAAATIALRPVSYLFFVMSLTPLFVLVAETLDPGTGPHLALARVASNVLGSVLGLVGSLALWPDPPERTFGGLLGDAVRANAEFASAALGGPNPGLHALRRRAGLSSNRAEAALRGMTLFSGTRRAAKRPARAMLVAIRKLAGLAVAAGLVDDPAALARQTAHRDRLTQIGQELAICLEDGRLIDRGLAAGLDRDDPLDHAMIDLIEAADSFAKLNRPKPAGARRGDRLRR